MMATGVIYRPPALTEISTLHRLDLTTFYEPWDLSLWKYCVENYFCRIATHQGRLVGVVVSTKVGDQPTQFRIMKTIVKGPHRAREAGEPEGIANYRYHGIGRELIGHVIQAARKADDVTHVDAWVPENFIFPVENLWCIGGFLDAIGFKHVETQTEMWTNQGYLEDGMRWELPLY